MGCLGVDVDFHDALIQIIEISADRWTDKEIEIYSRYHTITHKSTQK